MTTLTLNKSTNRVMTPRTAGHGFIHLAGVKVQRKQPAGKQPTSKQPTSKQPTQKKPKIEVLLDNWPMAFNLENPKPLAIGIQAELFKVLPDGLSRTDIRKAMSAWCASKAYLEAMVAAGEGRHRIGLDGQPAASCAGDITAEHIASAKKQANG